MSTPPAGVRREVEAALERLGSAGGIRAARALTGGCITPGARLEAADGSVYFVKWGHQESTPADFFRQEAASLEALASAGAARVPRVLDVANQWLLLEWLEPGPATVGGWSSLGAALADQHQQKSDQFGWDSDNYIGSLPQRNGRERSWSTFWRDRRLLPQLVRAESTGALTAAERTRFDRLLERLDDLLESGRSDGASLLHGDLWSGNVHFVVDGQAAVIDPSTYHGHREVDLAMAELFGGFPRAFFDSYYDRWPTLAGVERRRPAYQLYYLLVHVNLFGRGYVASALAALGAAVAGAGG